MGSSIDSQTTFAVNQIRKYLESGKPLNNSAVLLRSTTRFREVLERQMMLPQKQRDESEIKLYPSEAGKCLRGTFYKALGIPGEPFLADTRFKFMMGDLVELMIIAALYLASDVDIKDNNVKYAMQIGRGQYNGASDGILTSPGGESRNLEVKSMSKGGFAVARRKGVDNSFGYLTQACIYTRFMFEKKLINKRETVFLFVDRDSMHLHEEVVKFDDWHLAEEADEKFDSILDSIQAKKVPSRPYDLQQGKLGLQCKYCSHKHTCWVKPHQAVTYDANLEPVYRKKPTQQLHIVINRGKPDWTLIGDAKSD